MAVIRYVECDADLKRRVGGAMGDAAIQQLVRVRKSFAPNPASQKLYDRAFGVYRQVYKSCADLNHAIAAFASELHEIRKA